MHLQCHLGTDTRHGPGTAHVWFGLDFSPAAIEAATQLAVDCEIDAESAAPTSTTLETPSLADLSTSSIPALALWRAPDIDELALVVDGLLRPGGILYLVDIHPIVLGVLGDGRTLDQDIFQAQYVRWNEKRGTYAAPERDIRQHIDV